MLTVSAQLQQYPISDLRTWYKEKTLILNPNFQRRDNWTPSARSYLIDTILRGLPVPNIYIRMETNTRTLSSYRDVVDGQQRLRSIFGFIDGSFALGRNAKEYRGQKYEDLDDDNQNQFLAYQLGVVQLFNASDDVVLDIFQRLNAYGLSVNYQESRHGKYQGGKFKGEFRQTVIEASERWVSLWDKYKVVTVRSRVRMGDHELMAQMYGILLEGVVDGGQRWITKLYDTYDPGVPEEVTDKLDQTVSYILENFPDPMSTRISAAPHFLMLFAATAHALFGIPRGDMGDPYPTMPEKNASVLSDLTTANANLMTLSDVIEFEEDQAPDRFRTFKSAATSSTQRIRSRATRFSVIYQALSPTEI